MLKKILDLFSRQTTEKFDKKKLPKHVGVIMDGNARWASNKFLPMSMGHAKGAEAAWNITKEASDLGIEVLTLFTFSIENWDRSEAESSFIIEAVFNQAELRLNELHKRNIQARVIGDVSKLSEKGQQRIKELEKETSVNTGLKVVLAFSYSGRWDIIQAVNQVINQVKNNNMPDHITEEMFKPFLSLSDVPPPDLIIRTGGDIRISNFFLWQIAYSELYFTNTLWPSFNSDEFRKALNYYLSRERRFGVRKFVK